MPRKSKAVPALQADNFLRSINILYDANYPERIAHFQPTGKTIPLLNALTGQASDRAFFIVAPYGTGKSITATYLLHLVENRPQVLDALTEIETRLTQVSPDSGEFSTQRRADTDQHGLVLTFQGYQPSLSASLKEAVLNAMKRLKWGRRARTIKKMPCEDIKQAVALLTEVKKRVLPAGCDRILILWDEFGRHLESLVKDGRTAALDDLQSLAEFASRSDDIPVTLGLLLHQELLQYAGNLPMTVRSEWRKIEGRFSTIQYIDASKEIYRLIGEVVSSREPVAPHRTISFVKTAETCHTLGLFFEFSKAELVDLLKQAYPLEPTTLYLLPRLAARVAQNERTLFSFLYVADLEASVGPEQLFDYFTPAMRADTAVGGTYRQWVEAQSALSKVEDQDDETRVLKVACLLGFGTSGERSRASKLLLVSTLRGYGRSNRGEAAIDALIGRKLLLHRKHNDEVSVWHGTDLDLRGRLEDEKHRQRETFDLLAFLSDEASPPVWRPVEHNADFGVQRYLIGEYHNLHTFKAYLNPQLALDLDQSPQEIPVPANCDGKVIYVVAETAGELKEAETKILESLRHGRVVLAIPREPLPLFDAALEVWCLLHMQHDEDLVGADPLVVPELQQMADDARGHLERLVDRLVRPSGQGPRWFYLGKSFEANGPRYLRRRLSGIMNKVYSSTPRINNEMIVRHKPTPIMVNARKKLLLGILERSGQERLGIEGNFPDSSMFRTVLLHSGLYRQDEHNRWRYGSSEDIEDPGLRQVWQAIGTFLTAPYAKPKAWAPFLNRLMEPPFGVRAGVLPILITAGLKAFPSARSLTRDGDYLTDILPSDIELLCKESESHELLVLDLDDIKRAYLEAFYTCFSTKAEPAISDSDLIRVCFDTLEIWKAQLPTAALSTKRLTEQSRRFQAALRASNDPVRLLFERIPSALGCSMEDLDRLTDTLARCRDDLMDVVKIYRDSATTALNQTLGLGHEDASNGVREVAGQWARCFPDAFVSNLTDGVAKGLLSRMRMAYKSDHMLLESLSSLLVGKSMNRWNDVTVSEFEQKVHDVVRRIEEAALTADVDLADDGTAAHGLAQLVSGRTGELFDHMVKLVGEEEAERMFHSIIEHKTGRPSYGDDSGSVGQSA